MRAFRLGRTLAGLVLLACTARPALTGPQPLGHGTRIFKGAGELRIELAYEAHGPRDMTLLVDMSEVGGAEVGEIEVSLSADGFELGSGEVHWTARVPPHGTERRAVRLHAQREGSAALTVRIRNAGAPETVHEASIRFRVDDEDPIRPCQTEDEECR